MTTVTMILSVLLALCMSALLVEGGKCEIKGKGKMTKFNDKKFVIKIPCKYQAISFTCKGYHVKVTPGQILDSKVRYFTDTVWVAISKEGPKGTKYYWKGRTSTKRVDRHFNDTSKTPFSTKDENLSGAPFSIKTSTNPQAHSVEVGVSEVHLDNFKVVFSAYHEKNKQRRKNAGVKIICDDSSFTEESHFPVSMCGNKTNTRDVRDRRKLLGFGAKSKVVIYDVLNDMDVKQTNPQCAIASNTFRTCGSDRTQVIKACAAVISNSRIMKCLNKYNYNPMNVFVHCLKYQCSGDGDSCYLFKEALDGCPSNADLPKGPCPSSVP